MPNLNDDLRIVADLGNSRLKWAKLGVGGKLEGSVALPLDDASEWRKLWETWNPGNQRGCRWGISSVNPPVAERLGAFLRDLAIDDVTWYRSAKHVRVRHALRSIETAGADRALAVLAAENRRVHGKMNVVVLCGSAITVERISSEGIWEGGAIALGLGMSARALHELTAQLPWVPAVREPRPWGDSTRPALEAGIYWGVVGAIREILTRQGDPVAIGQVLWTGGDASWLAASVDWPGSEVHPDLVLLGLADLHFGTSRS